MAKINILDSSVYNLIAAGEVVERPSSVVKELVENCIDANAKNIKVEIIDGGIKKIVVSDDGCGIEQEYLKNAFLPHATSKIEKAADLDNILSLGFRGEALASIAAVSNVTLVSKAKAEDIGNQISLSAGKITSQSPVGAADGTTITIEDLFFNVPARAKFLKKPISEQQEITNMMQRFVLANPGLNFSYYADGKHILSSEGSTLQDAMYSVYGSSVIKETLPISGRREGLTLSGYIGRPSYAKANRTYQTIVINGRYVQNTTIATAVTNAYGEMLMKRKYPFFVINLQIDPSKVDVNVHPNKMEVRFENPNQIFSLVYEATSRALSEMDYVLEVDTTTGEVTKHHDGMNVAINFTPHDAAEQEFVHAEIARKSAYAAAPSKIDKAGVELDSFGSSSAESISKQPEQTNAIEFNFDQIANAARETSEKQVNTLSAAIKMSDDAKVADNFGLGSKLLEQLASDAKKQKEEQQCMQSKEFENLGIKTIGKLFNTYILVEYGSNLYMIDQHAAHERVLYEKFTRQVNNKAIAVQPLMFPYTLPVNPTEYNLISACLPQLKELGFDIEEFGDRTFKISSVPLLLAEIDLQQFFAGFLAEYRGAITIKQTDVIKEKLMQHSCKSAIKGGNDLSKTEIESLFALMNDEKIPLFCPHGRPIAVRITKSEIEKWFKRIV